VLLLDGRISFDGTAPYPKDCVLAYYAIKPGYEVWRWTSATEKKMSSSSGANPFICDMLVDGKRCPNDAAWLYRTVYTTKLVCDGCRGELTATKGLIVGAPVVEVALLELMPARAALLAELDEANKALTEASKSLAELGHAYRGLVECLALVGFQRQKLEQVFSLVAIIGAALVWGAWMAAPHWAFYVASGLYGLILRQTSWVVYHIWIAKKREALVKKYGQ
jgi:hypothetical protein